MGRLPFKTAVSAASATAGAAVVLDADDTDEAADDVCKDGLAELAVWTAPVSDDLALDEEDDDPESMVFTRW